MKTKNQWFRAKRFGWGWQPASWQGWIITVVYIIGLINIAMDADRVSHSTSDTLLAFAPAFIVLTIIFLAIAYLTGEKPGWHWNGKPRR